MARYKNGQRTESATAFGQNLKALMDKKNVDAKTLAAATSMHISIIYYYIKGDRIPNTPSIFRLAKALGVEPSTIFRMIDENDFARSIQHRIDAKNPANKRRGAAWTHK